MEMLHKWLWVFVCLTALSAALFLLYRKNCFLTKNIRALLFVFQPEKDHDSAVLDACTGWAKHTVRFEGGGGYEFRLEAALRSGEAKAAIENRGTSLLLKLDSASPTGRITLDSQTRCTVRWEFRNASGRCKLSWKRL